VRAESRVLQARAALLRGATNLAISSVSFGNLVGDGVYRGDSGSSGMSFFVFSALSRFAARIAALLRFAFSRCPRSSASFGANVHSLSRSASMLWRSWMSFASRPGV
jgi:hypothetical protein